MVQLFAIQSCPILHGPVIVFDPRDVEILRQLGVSSIANESVSTTAPGSLVQDLEEAKRIRKGKFVFKNQLPDLLPTSVHTTMAARILKKRRLVPFEHKSVTKYTQAIKYFKESPTGKEIIDGKQFDLKKPKVGLYIAPPSEPAPAANEEEASTQAETPETSNNDKPEEETEKSTEVSNETGKVNDDKTNETEENAEESSKKRTVETRDVSIQTEPQVETEKASKETDKVNNESTNKAEDVPEESSEKSSGKTPESNSEAEEAETPEAPEESNATDTNMADAIDDNANNDKNDKTEDSAGKTSEKDAVESPDVDMEPLEVNTETPDSDNAADTEIKDANANTDNNRKSKQDEGTEMDSPTAQQKEAAPPQEDDSTSPGALMGAAELVKLRRRAASTKNTTPAPPATVAPKKRGRTGRPPKNKSPTAAETSCPTNAAASAKRRGRLPTKANTSQVAEAASPSFTAETTPVASPASDTSPTEKRSPIKKRGRKAKEAVPSIAALAAAEAAIVANKPPVKKRSRPPKAKQAAEPTLAVEDTPEAEVAMPQAKKRGRSPKNTTAASATSRASSPPKKRGRTPKNQTTVVDAAAVAPAPAVTPAPAPPMPNPTDASRRGSAGSSSSNATSTETIDAETEETITNYAAAIDAAVAFTPTRKPRVSMGPAPSTPNYHSEDNDSDGEEPFLPVMDSPVTKPAGSGHHSTANAGAKWNEKFLELFRYKMEYGDCNVSAKAADNPHKALGEWVRIQRRRKNGKSKLKPLSKEEEVKLSAIGFDWRSTSKLEWEGKFQELVKYKMAYGNADVPDEYEENPALGIWCFNQRENWRQKIIIEKHKSMMDEGEGGELPESVIDENGNEIMLSSAMTDEEEGKLLALGFRF